MTNPNIDPANPASPEAGAGASSPAPVVTAAGPGGGAGGGSSAYVSSDAAVAATGGAGGAGGQSTFTAEYVHELRAENAKSRQERNELRAEIEAAKTAGETAAQAAAEKATRELAQNLGKALGLVDADAAPTPEALLEQAKAAQAAAEQQRADAERTAQSASATAKTAQVEAELYRRAVTAGADPLALIDSRTFMDRADVRALDPASAEFSTQVDAVIKAATDADPRYRAGRVSPRSGGNLAAGNGDPQSGATPPSSVQAFLDDKFKAMSGGKGGKVHARFLRGTEQGRSAEPMTPGMG